MAEISLSRFAFSSADRFATNLFSEDDAEGESLQETSDKESAIKMTGMKVFINLSGVKVYGKHDLMGGEGIDDNRKNL